MDLVVTKFDLLTFSFQLYIKLTYMIVVGLLGIATIVVVMTEQFNQPEYRAVRAIVFVSLVRTFKNTFLSLYSTIYLLRIIFTYVTSVMHATINFFLNGPTPASFLFIFGLFKQTLQFLQQ